MKICVYGASSNEIDKSYILAGERLGEEMAKRGHELVFGAGGSGMMGAAARGMTKEKGRILGIVPSFFNVDGILYEKCDEIVFTETMRERKQLMEVCSDAFVMTAGGIGTFEEFFEILTLKQLDRHQKPIVILNTNGYYNRMLEMLDFTMEEKFARDKTKELYFVTDDIDAALDYIEGYRGEQVDISEHRFVK